MLVANPILLKQQPFQVSLWLFFLRFTESGTGEGLKVSLRSRMGVSMCLWGPPELRSSTSSVPKIEITSYSTSRTLFLPVILLLVVVYEL
jgi:hypothetical protein